MTAVNALLSGVLLVQALTLGQLVRMQTDTRDRYATALAELEEAEQGATAGQVR